MKYRVLSMILVLVLAAGLVCVPVRAAEGDWQYTQIDGGLRLTAYLGNETELTLPDTLAGQPVLEIGSGCFRGSKLKVVTVPHGIRVVGEEAFYGSAELKKVILGGSVNVIGDRAFANTGLIKMDIPGCVRTIGEEAFLNCTALENVVIEGGVEEWNVEIGDGAGSGSVTMEEGVESIGARAFYGCTKLTRMRLPASVTVIGTHAIGYTDEGLQAGYKLTGYEATAAQTYANANGLTFVPVERASANSGVCGEEINWGFDRENGVLHLVGSGRMYDYAAAECLPWYAFRQEITGVVMGESITSVGEYAFSGSDLEMIELPASLAWVGKEAFANCAALNAVTFNGDAPVFGVNAFENTTAIAWYPNWNGTWTSQVLQNYGGTITWMPLKGLPFVDVPEDSFYYDPVAWALEKGITTGTDATHFSPNNECQRAAVVTFLWRAAGSPEPESTVNPFLDVVPSDFYYKAVMWAVEQKITNGLDDTHFGPFAFCNRAQVVTFLYRAMGSPAVSGLNNPFTDVASDAWYLGPVLWAVDRGITNGLSATTFGPDSICNRAQIVTFLYRTMAEQSK